MKQAEWRTITAVLDIKKFKLHRTRRGEYIAIVPYRTVEPQDAPAETNAP